LGYAVLVAPPADLRRINPEAIIICPRMSPIFSIALQTVRGIVSEYGGMTSTTATVAREYGLPVVTGMKSAGQVISEGDLVRIDGARGIVQINHR